MLNNKWWKTGAALLTILIFCMWVLELDAWARAGGGMSSGSRGSRSYSSPSSPSSSSARTSSPSANPSPTQPMTSPMPQQAPSMWRTFAAGAMGGLLGSMLFSSFGHGAGMGGLGGSGIGLMEILLLGLVLYGIYRFIKGRRQQEAMPTSPYAYQGQASPSPGQPAPYPPAGGQAQDDVFTGLGHIRQMDPSFNDKKFTDLCMDNFFKIQGAWANRDMTSVRNILTEEMLGILQGDAERLKAQKQINKLDNIAIRTVEITEAWQEDGKDFITVRILASLLDYTVSEGGDLVAGSKTEPVKFEEYWTFTRSVGGNAWQLSAINQA